MKKLFYCLVFCALSVGTVHAQTSGTGGTHAWSYTITPATTHKSIDSLTADWKSHGIDFRLYKPLYDANGVLVKFAGSVAYFSGKSHAGAKFGNETHKTIVIEVTDKPSVSVSGK